MPFGYSYKLLVRCHLLPDRLSVWLRVGGWVEERNTLVPMCPLRLLYLLAVICPDSCGYSYKLLVRCHLLPDRSSVWLRFCGWAEE